MPTFPPTAMVYSVNKVPPQSNNPETSGKVNNVSTSLIAQVLSHPEPTSKPRRIFICKLCAKDFVFTHQSTQTNFSYNQDTNGYSGGLSQMTAARTNHPHYHGHIMPPGVHRPRLNSTETEIWKFGRCLPVFRKYSGFSGPTVKVFWIFWVGASHILRNVDGREGGETKRYHCICLLFKLNKILTESVTWGEWGIKNAQLWCSLHCQSNVRRILLKHI